MRSRLTNVVRALGALAALTGLIAGVPALLVAAVGNPFPAEFPTVDEVRVVLTQNGDGFGQFLLAAIALVVWFLWLQMMAALVVEVVAALRRRPARALPTAPGIQPMMRQLVAALALSVSLAGAPVLAPALGALHLDAIAVDLPEPVGAEPAPAVAEPPSEVSGPTVRLHERTELWDLAEAAYGDGLAWTEIAAANAGSLDAEGVPLSGASEAVAAGTVLRMPGSPAAAAVADFGTHVVAPGESLWSIAADEAARRLPSVNDAAVASYWNEVVAANAETPSGDVDIIYPGDEVILPGAVAAGGSPSEEPVVDTVDRDLGDPDLTEPPPRIVADLSGVIDGPVVDGSHRQSSTTSSGHAASTIAAADVEAGLNERVDIAESSSTFDVRRRNVSAVEVPQAPLAEADLSTGTGSDADGGGGVPASAIVLGTTGGGLLAVGVLGALRRRRALQWRQRAPGRVPQRPSDEAAAFEAILAEAANQVQVSQLGNDWVAIEGATVERVLDAARRDNDVAGVINEIDLRDGASDGDSNARLHVTAIIGTEEVTTSPIFIGLAAGSQTAIEGTDQDIARVAQLLLLDLAVSDRIDDVRVIAVGVGPKLGDLERVDFVDSWSDACVVAHRLGAVDQTDGPIVAIGVTPGDKDSLALLASLGSAAVGPITDAADRIRVDGDRAVLEPSGIEVLLAALPDEDFGLVAELIETTALSADEPAGAVPEGELPEVAGCPLAAGPIEVRVLGPVEVVGASAFSSVKAVDVVTYLAFHRQGVDADQLKTWVWPSFEPPTDKAFANVMSRARTGLGAAEDGAPYLSRAGSDRLYRLDSAVTTDFDRLRGLVDLADDTTDQRQQLIVLQQALELVRGIPFSGGTATSFAWADSSVRSHVEFSIDETVHRCADLALELGDFAAARAAIRTGLLVVPGCEQCFRRRFLVARADNNRQELRSAMADLERTSAAELGEPEGVDCISRDLLMLFEELDRDLIAGTP